MRELDEEADRALEKIGISLEKGITPTVHDGGIVMPGQATDVLQYPGKENTNVRQETRRSAAGSRQGSAGRERAAGRPRAAGAATPVVKSGIESEYSSQQIAIQSAYPSARFLWQSDGFWLCTNSLLLRGCEKHASIISYIPFSPHLPRSWGFWPGNVWIGPRHTNFPDGSICSFEPSDQIWVPGDSIVALLDLHTLWAVRHLHLDIFGKWPGPQCVRHSYERILELQPNELCGCNAGTGKYYSDCCQTEDLAKNRLRTAINFSLTHNGGIRQPPESIRNLLHTFRNPPRLDLGRCFA